MKPLPRNGEVIITIKDCVGVNWREIKRGRWLEHQEGRWIYAKCSVCNSVQNTKTNYCKDCGAKMDLEVTE